MSSSFHIDKFSVHTRTDIESVVHKNNKVCVVSIIGKSRLIPGDCKASCFNSILKTDAFKGFTDQNWHTLDSTCRVDGYYDTQAGIVFLNLLSTWDTSVLANITKRIHDDGQQDFSSVWRSSECSHMRALLFIFSVSHIIVVANPGTSFDVSYIRLFKTLDSVRLKIQPLVSEHLKHLPISKDWLMSCRPCSPRVLFAFEYPALDSYLTESDTKSHGNSSLVKELQHAIEDQVYRILRKSRIITNTSNNSLFAIPQNQEFVYIHPMQSTSTRDLINFYLTRLKNSCSGPTERVSSRSKSYQLNRKARTESSNDREKVSSISRDVKCRSPSSESSSFGSIPTDEEGFSGFLNQHINLALTKGFDDNVGRNPVQAIFELPSLSVWFSVVNKLHGVYWSDTVDAKIQTQFTAMKSLMDIDMRFSDGHCRKVLPVAEAAYSEGLPPNYTLDVHNTKLQEAVNVFLHHARGPACEKYIAQLKEDCTRIWRDGRQMCEEISLTGNHCINELHRLPDMPEMESTKHLPVMPHSSQIKNKCACNCGQRIGEREDPFEHRMANYDFYQRLEQQCCAKLEHYEMSVFKPSTTEVHPAEVVVQTSVAFVDEPESPTVVRKESSKFDLTFRMSGGSFALSLGQSGCSDLFMHDTESQDSPEDEESPPEDEDNDEAGSMTTTDEDEVEARVKDIEAVSLSRQHSTTEYLPGMLHTDSLPGLLPKFPSWSLVLLGKYSSYNPAQGVDQPGFLLPSNFLLPLDVTVEAKTTGSNGSISGNDMPGKKGKIKKPVKDVVQVVRLYIGMEYECSRGHRFFLSSPDRIFKAPPSGLFKETGHKVVNHDMPLYFPCSCRSQGQVMGQLMRVHLAIPEGGVEVKLRPKVQPAPPPCPLFFPEASECLVLRSGVWVLRLPFIYMGETGAYRMPTNPQLQSACRFVKGFLSVTECT